MSIRSQNIGSSAINTLTTFRLTDAEWAELDQRFGDLCKFAAWQLLRKNLRNSHTDDLDDIEQECKRAVVTAGMYYKRQVFIEACLESLQEHVKDEFGCKLVGQLKDLWQNRTKHGANRQKFGGPQERMLQSLVERYVPQEARPDINAPLRIDKKFATYCKAITWNTQKTMGRKITKERAIRTGMVSLSHYSYAGAMENQELFGT